MKILIFVLEIVFEMSKQIYFNRGIMNLYYHIIRILKVINIPFFVNIFLSNPMYTLLQHLTMHAQISGKVGESDANVLKMQCNAELMPAYGWTTNMVYRKPCFLFVYLNVVSPFLSAVTHPLILFFQPFVSSFCNRKHQISSGYEIERLLDLKP